MFCSTGIINSLLFCTLYSIVIFVPDLLVSFVFLFLCVALCPTPLISYMLCLKCYILYLMPCFLCVICYVCVKSFVVVVKVCVNVLSTTPHSTHVHLTLGGKEKIKGCCFCDLLFCGRNSVSDQRCARTV